MQDTSVREYAVITPKTNAAPGEWMTLQAASNATGLSMATLRRYIKRRTIKGRRLGKTSNAKVEVFITPGFMEVDSDKDRIATEGLDEILNGEIEEPFEEDDEADQATRETVEWLREKIDDKDEKIAELSQKLDTLNQQLAAASYRNGYLESQQQNNQEQIKLLTMQVSKPLARSGLKEVVHWFTGKGKSTNSQ